MYLFFKKDHSSLPGSVILVGAVPELSSKRAQKGTLDLSPCGGVVHKAVEGSDYLGL